MRALLAGVGLGWAAGISPGPLMMLVVNASLRGGPAAGARVALAPLVTDLPLLGIGLLTAATIPERLIPVMLGFGAVYLTWLGVRELRAIPGLEFGASTGSPDLRRAVVVNWTSPHVWLFWLTVGGPFVASTDSLSEAVSFLVGFFALLVGIKLILAGLVGWRAHRLSVRAFRMLASTGAVGLMLFAAFLGWEAITRL